MGHKNRLKGGILLIEFQYFPCSLRQCCSWKATLNKNISIIWLPCCIFIEVVFSYFIVSSRTQEVEWWESGCFKISLKCCSKEGTFFEGLLSVSALDVEWWWRGTKSGEEEFLSMLVYDDYKQYDGLLP